MVQREGLRIDEIYAETGSAHIRNSRPEFDQLVEDIKAGRINRLVVMDVSRLIRNVRDACTNLRLLEGGKLMKRFI